MGNPPSCWCLFCPRPSLDNFSSDCLPTPPPDPSGRGISVASIRLSSLPAIPDDFSKMFPTSDTIMEDLEGEELDRKLTNPFNEEEDDEAEVRIPDPFDMAALPPPPPPPPGK